MYKYLLALALFVSACTYSTPYGDCIGAFDDKKPDLVYKVNIGNIFWGVVGAEFIYPPIKVIVDATFCPVGKLTPGPDLGKDAPINYMNKLKPAPVRTVPNLQDKDHIIMLPSSN